MSNQRDYNRSTAPGDSDNQSNDDYDKDTVGGTDRTYARDAVTGESGYGAGEVGSINRGSERGGVTTGSSEDTAANDEAPNPGSARTAADGLAASGMGARYSEANAAAGELTDSDQGYAAGAAGGSGADEARRFHTSSDPEYGERDMGYDDPTRESESRV